MSAVAKDPPAALRPGQFVTATTNAFGIGKLLRYASRCEVEYFNAIDETERMRLEVPRRDLRFAAVVPGTACFWQTGARWRSGRIEAIAGEQCCVGAPTGAAVTLPVSAVYVRAEIPLHEPGDLLRAGLTDPARDYAARNNWLACSLEQRAASRGLDGITSSAVRLHVHQLEVARQVLMDPVQRFLLGDEVGLGKTIEAGFIIRQLLVDDPRASVKVLAPATLIPQWREELAWKFGADQFPHADITLEPLERPKAWAGGSPLDLLVVDEAHRATGDPSQPIFQALHPLAHRTPRLLLLSSTPALNHERAFLGLLHLLEPTIYRLDDLAGFKDRLERRADLSQIILTFGPDQPNFHLRSAIRRLVEHFPDDPRIVHLAARAEPLLSSGADVDANERAAAVTALEVHVSETYRLHRRLLRTRRTDAAETGTLVRGRRNPQECSRADGWMSEVHDLVDAWRATLSEVSHALDRIPEAALMCPPVFARAGSDPALLMALIQYRLTRDETYARAALLAGRAGQRIATFPLVDEEKSVLVDLVDLLNGDGSAAGYTGRFATALDAASDAHDAKTVVFTGFEPVVTRLSATLKHRLGDAAVAHVARSSGTDDRAADLVRFRRDPGCSVLVAGNIAQEGLNLEFADRVIHVDLPWLPNRLEQRIGRLDRYATAPPFDSVVILDGGPVTTFADAWFRCLRDGFRVFERSIASFQFVLDAITSDIRRRVLAEGVDGLLAAADELPGRLEQELAEIEERESLDSLRAGPEALRLLQRLSDGDRNADRLLAALDSAKDLIGVQRVRELANATVFGLQGDALEEDGEQRADRRFSVEREEALLEQDVELLRPGHPIFDALDRHIASGGRGRAFALRRQAATGSEEDAIFWRFDFIAGADLGAMASSLGGELGEARSALQRRVGWYLPERLLTIWLDGTLAVVRDAATLLELEEGSGGRDLDLGSAWPLEGLVEEIHWQRTFEEALAAARTAAAAHPDFVRAVRSAQDIAAAALALAIDQAAARDNVDPVDAPYNDESEIAIRRAVVEALKRPAARLDALGIVVLSPDSIPG